MTTAEPALPPLTPEQIEGLRYQKAGPWRFALATWFVPPVIVCLIAIFAPSDILRISPVLAAFCNWMVQLFPFLDLHASSSDFPEVTLFVKCLSFAMQPLMWLTGFWYPWLQRRLIVIRVKLGLVKQVPLWMPAFLVFVAVPLIASDYLIAGDPSFAKGLTTASRLGLGLGEASGLWVHGLASGGMFIYFYVRIHIKS